MTMKFSFVKYQGTGNDFVMLDNMDGKYNAMTIAQIQAICDRKMGIGADGLIKISKHPDCDFEVEYYNSDGSQSFCGNGARCSVAFAKELGIVDKKAVFLAIDGVHNAFIDGETFGIEMLPVEAINRDGDDYVLDTGSPHYIRLTDKALDIVELGKQIRYSDKYATKGINVNTMQSAGKGVIDVATYERGVEDETLSCGTGVTACALVYYHLHPEQKEAVQVNTKGGILAVSAERNYEGFNNIWLSGPAKRVFDGVIEL